MKRIFGFIKLMLKSGVIFFIPLIIVILILQKAFQLAAVIVLPVIKILGTTQIFGIGAEIIISIAVILFIVYLGGLISRTSPAKKQAGNLNQHFYLKFRDTILLKKREKASPDSKIGNLLPTVLARIEDAWQLAFMIEEIKGEQYAVYVPGAPNPLSGSVYFLEKNRILKTTIPMSAAMACLRGLGKGSNELLKDYI